MPKDQNFIEEVLLDYKEGMDYVSEQLPRLTRKYHAFTEVCFAKGKLQTKDKQLMALAISVAMNDDYCMVYHTKMCVDEGATEAEILEAVAVAAAFRAGPSLSQAATLIRDAIEAFEKEQDSSGSDN